MRNTFNPLQRLHFYAALFITPLLLTLTISGIGYLFFNDVENKIYDHQFFGKSEEKSKQSLDSAVKEIESTYKGYNIDKISIMEKPYNDRVTISNSEGEQRYIFLDENNQKVANQNAKYTYSNVMRNIHSSLFTENTFINYMVELTACWTIFMIVSGLYMIIKKKLYKNKNKKFALQKWHAILGVILSIPLVIIVLTGIPWSAFMGSHINKWGEDYPNLGRTELRYNPPQSDINEIPWATRGKKEPMSHDEHKGHAGHHSTTTSATDLPYQLTIDKISSNAQNNDIKKPFSIVYPSDEKGVFTVSNGSNTGVTGLDVSPNDEKTIYYDQYTGEQLGKVSYSDYGLIGKWFTWGIPLHEGHLFGMPNKIINLLVCIAFLGAIVLGFTSWINRTKNLNSMLPNRVNKPLSVGLILTLIILGILMPLFGLSIIIVVLIEYLIYFKNK